MSHVPGTSHRAYLTYYNSPFRETLLFSFLKWGNTGRDRMASQCHTVSGHVRIQNPNILIPESTYIQFDRKLKTC